MNTFQSEFTGTQELNNINHKLNRAIDQISNIVSNKISQQLQQRLRKNLLLIKREILGVFQTITYEQFQKVFFVYYGNNYDVNALNQSLTFFIDDNLRPYLTYNVKDFILKSDFNEDERTFNQNARIDGDFNNLLSLEELDALEEVNFYGMTFGEENPYDYATEGMTEPEDYKVFKNKKILLDPIDIYKKAENEALEAYQHEYKVRLKPYFEKKYGVEL